MRWAHRPRRWRIDRLAKHQRRIVVVQADPTGTAAAAATTTTTADPHCQPRVRSVNAGALLVEDMECRQANVGHFFFMQHHLLAYRIWVGAANCSGRAACQR